MTITIYMEVPAANAPSAPVKTHIAPEIAEDGNVPALKTEPQVLQQAAPVSQQAAPVLKQVTPAAMQALDLRLPCGFTADEIESVTKYNLVGLGGDFAAQDGNINAIFLMSVAALESGWGRHTINRYNLFGMYRYFPQSYAQCIDHVAGYLAENYINQDGRWHNGVTVSEVNVDYCVNPKGSPKTSWTNEVSIIMAKMYNQIYNAEYQQGT
jgi:beta-N-acetylglucosaminidase